MSEGENKSYSNDDRYKYIGFEVFPGKAGDIFESNEERQSIVEKVMRKFNRSDGEVRDHCTLMEERVSKTERGFLTLAAVLLFLSLFLPWFSGYYEIITEKLVPAEGESVAAVVDTTEAASDTTEMVASSDTTLPAGETDAAATQMEESPDTATALATTGDENVPTDTIMAGAATEDAEGEMITVTEVTHDNRSVSGFGAIFSIGTYGSMIFSSGFILIISGILLILYIISCIGMAGFNLYILYGVKKADPDEYVIYLKQMLKHNWIPVYVWLALLGLSIFGASYGFDSSSVVKQVGESYGIAAFVGLSSSGIYLSLAAFLMLALKGKEI